MQEVDELENIILSKVTWAQMLYILSHMWDLCVCFCDRKAEQGLFEEEK